MERSAIRDSFACGAIPDYAALHPGYCRKRVWLRRPIRDDTLLQNNKPGANMSAAADSKQEAQWKRWRAVADLYHAYFTGLILTVVTRRGTADAAEFVFRVFRRQQQERFLPGL